MDGNSFFISRDIFDSQVFSHSGIFRLWIYLIGRARYKDGYANFKNGRGEESVKLKRGQILTGRYSLEQSLDVDASTLYKWLIKLQEWGNINIESNKQYSIITICNYDKYQPIIKQEEQASNIIVAAKEQHSNNIVTTKEQHSNTNNKDNNVNNDNNEENVMPAPQNFINFEIDSKIKDDFEKLINHFKFVGKKLNSQIVESNFRELFTFCNGNFENMTKVINKTITASAKNLILDRKLLEEKTEKQESKFDPKRVNQAWDEKYGEIKPGKPLTMEEISELLNKNHLKK